MCEYPDSPESAGSSPEHTYPVVRVRLYNSVATQLDMTRFEFRLLRFFNDSCIPLLTFGVNKNADYVWRNVLPHAFASLDLVRQSVFSFACLNLWPFTDLTKVLESDNFMMFHGEGAQQGVSRSEHAFLHVFQNLRVFENSEENIFSLTANYFGRTLAESHGQIGQLYDNEPSGSDLDVMFFSSSLVFAFLGLHPHKIIPLLLVDDAPIVDYLSLISNLSKFFEKPFAHMLLSLIPFVDNFRKDSLHKLPYRSNIVATLRTILSDFYFGDTFFADISATACEEHAMFSSCLDTLEHSYSEAVEMGYPVPIFRFLLLMDSGMEVMCHQKHRFALRFLFVYSCMCLFCGFHILPQSNIWIDYIHWYVENYSPLDKFDEQLHYYVVVQKREVNHYNFRATVIEFDRVLTQMLELELIDSDDFI